MAAPIRRTLEVGAVVRTRAFGDAAVGSVRKHDDTGETVLRLHLVDDGRRWFDISLAYGERLAGRTGGRHAASR